MFKVGDTVRLKPQKRNDEAYLSWFKNQDVYDLSKWTGKVTQIKNDVLTNVTVRPGYDALFMTNDLQMAESRGHPVTKIFK